MSPIKTSVLEKALTDKGFELSSTHHDMYWLHNGTKKTSVRTRISHSSKEYDDNLLSLMSKQTKLSRADFQDLIDCPLSKEDYIAKLIKAGHVKP